MTERQMNRKRRRKEQNSCSSLTVIKRSSSTKGETRNTKQLFHNNGTIQQFDKGAIEQFNNR